MKSNDRVFEVEVNGRKYRVEKTKMINVAINYNVYSGEDDVGSISKLGRNDENFLVLIHDAEIPGHIELARNHQETYMMDGVEVSVHGTCNYKGMYDLCFDRSLTHYELKRKQFELFISENADLSRSGFGDKAAHATTIEEGVAILDMLVNNPLTGLVFCEWDYDKLRECFSEDEMKAIFGDYTVETDEDDE